MSSQGRRGWSRRAKCANVSRETSSRSRITHSYQLVYRENVSRETSLTGHLVQEKEPRKPRNQTLKRYLRLRRRSEICARRSFSPAAGRSICFSDESRVSITIST